MSIFLHTRVNLRKVSFCSRPSEMSVFFRLETNGQTSPALQYNSHCIYLLGIRVVYNLQKTPGSRVVSLKVRCHKCHVPAYSPVEMDEEYSILLDDWLIRGGGGYNMFKEENIIERLKLSEFTRISFSCTPVLTKLYPTFGIVNTNKNMICQYIGCIGGHVTLSIRRYRLTSLRRHIWRQLLIWWTSTYRNVTR